MTRNGRIEQGRLILDPPLDLPNGTPVTVTILEVVLPTDSEEAAGLRELKVEFEQ